MSNNATNNNAVVGVDVGEAYDKLHNMSDAEMADVARQTHVEYSANTNSMMPAHQKLFSAILMNFKNKAKEVFANDADELHTCLEILTKVEGAFGMLAMPDCKDELELDGDNDRALRDILKSHYDYVKNAMSAMD